MSISVRELYDRHPFNYNVQSWPLFSGLDECAGLLGDLHLQEDPVAFLENLQYSEEGYAAQIKAATVLAELPPEVVIENFGEGVAVWLYCAHDLERYDASIGAALEKKLGINSALLELTRDWHCANRLDTPSEVILENYRLTKEMQGTLDEIDLERVLSGSANPDVELSSKRLADYSVAPLTTIDHDATYNTGRAAEVFTPDNGMDTWHNIWLDAPSGFALLYKGLPNAVAGIAMRGIDSVIIHQIQGTHNSTHHPTDSNKARVLRPRGLAPLDWRKVMVEITEQLARSRGLGSTTIRAAHNNQWTVIESSVTGAPLLPMKAAVRTYDETAARLGYVQPELADDARQNWHKEL